MNTYLAFLRGINVGGHNKIPMQELRDLLNQIGFKDVKTYIQTGNIIFKTSSTDRNLLASKIKNGIYNQFGFDIPVLIKTPTQIISILEKCPFTEEEKLKSYFALLYDKATIQQIQSLKSYSFPDEKFQLIDDCIYLYSSIGYGKSKANNNFFEKKIKIKLTTRNYNTLNKLVKLLED
ncbi:DUF1697 domain-containing protein [Olleya sp. R77988]|uniref:DUF1697 domain-containing protein n=1 Tax=Olleya sp. R77988 TaxID=3093875 RepID=UPI0037C844D1